MPNSSMEAMEEVVAKMAVWMAQNELCPPDMAGISWSKEDAALCEAYQNGAGCGRCIYKYFTERMWNV